MLLEDSINESVNVGYIYLYSTDERHPVHITDRHRRTVRKIVSRIRSMSVDSIPSLTDNPSKCDACSARHYCMPEETARLEPERARGTGWEDEI
jgi:CRISPR-associated exonuclease Cas4